jgi:hypothetical protein
MEVKRFEMTHSYIDILKRESPILNRIIADIIIKHKEDKDNEENDSSSFAS